MRVADDTDGADFDFWKSQAEDGIARFKSRGLHVEKVMIDVDELAAWCTRHHLPNVNQVRAFFVTLKLAQT